MADDDALKASLRDSQTRFAAAVESIRPELHRYCTRMSGSALDGEDLVQEALAQAYYRLALTPAEVPLGSLLFTIAHHRCVDFLRGRRAAAMVELDEADEPVVEADLELETRNLARKAFAQLLATLPPRERSAVVLKEVLGFSLAEIASVLETTVGGVKAALHRGRQKLEAAEQETAAAPEEALPAYLTAYLDAFNRRDWVGLQTLFEDGVQLELVGHKHVSGGKGIAETYLNTFAKLPWGWKLVPCEIDGEAALLCLRETDGAWVPRHAIRLQWRDGRVARIRDYGHVSYLLAEAELVFTTAVQPPGKMTMTTQEKNKATFAKLIDEVINTGKLERSQELLTADRPDHQEMGLPPELTRGYAGFQRTVGLFREAFPDLRFKSEFMMADGDLVLSNNTITGTHRAPFLGVPPTGKSFRTTALDICRFNAEGKISEHWGVIDMMSIMMQLGAMPPPGGR